MIDLKSDKVSIEPPEKVDAAYTFARRIKMMAIGLVICFLLTFIPFVGYLGIAVLLIIFPAIRF